MRKWFEASERHHQALQLTSFGQVAVSKASAYHLHIICISSAYYASVIKLSCNTIFQTWNWTNQHILHIMHDNIEF